MAQCMPEQATLKFDLSFGDILHHKLVKAYQFNKLTFYRKDTEPLYHSFMYSLVSLLSSIYPLPAMHSLLVTLYVAEVI